MKKNWKYRNHLEAAERTRRWLEETQKDLDGDLVELSKVLARIAVNHAKNELRDLTRTRGALEKRIRKNRKLQPPLNKLIIGFMELHEATK